ncbi:protein translocase subunit SecA [Folsomia candida]|nr:protein translocase subunit SecA [Folsomia candida]
MGNRRQEFVIIDEADTAMVDDVFKLARLSMQVPGFDLLHIIFQVLFDRAKKIRGRLVQRNGSYYYVDHDLVRNKAGEICFARLGQDGIPKLIPLHSCKDSYFADFKLLTEDPNAFVETHLKSFLTATFSPEIIEGFEDIEKIRIPLHLQKYVTLQIPKWVESVSVAENYMEKVHYLVHNGQIKPIDYWSTGIIQDSTAWNNGLHQLLQRKHGLHLTAEPLTTNFLSNLSLIRRYWNNDERNIIGFSGTLGTRHTREILGEIFNTVCIDLPEIHYKKFILYDDIITTSRERWASEIIFTLHAQIHRGKGTLIICGTMRDALFLRDRILASKLPHNGVKLYIQNDEDQEKQISHISQRQIFNATNLACRGTDIVVHVGMEEDGGLHVILAYLPDSDRVEQQAFGRTARQGNSGSGQLICHVINKSSRNLRQSRDELELSNMQDSVNNYFSNLANKEECFIKFCNFLEKVRRQFCKEKNFVTKIFSNKYSHEDLTIIQALEERWGRFLLEVDTLKKEVVKEKYQQI